MTFRDWGLNVGTSFSVLVNALLFGEYGETLSCRIGRAMLRGSMCARIPMPRRLREHFERAADRL